MLSFPPPFIAEGIFSFPQLYYCLACIAYLPLSIERFFKITLGHIDKLGDYFFTHEVYIGDIYIKIGGFSRVVAFSFTSRANGERCL